MGWRRREERERMVEGSLELYEMRLLGSATHVMGTSAGQPKPKPILLLAGLGEWVVRRSLVTTYLPCRTHTE